MRRAVHGGYAVGYFESWNIESLQGVIDAAEQTRSPIIAGFNGGFLSGHDRPPTIALSVPQRVVARRMEHSKQTIPHF